MLLESDSETDNELEFFDKDGNSKIQRKQSVDEYQEKEKVKIPKN